MDRGLGSTHEHGDTIVGGLNSSRRSTSAAEEAEEDADVLEGEGGEEVVFEGVEATGGGRYPLHDDLLTFRADYMLI